MFGIKFDAAEDAASNLRKAIDDLRQQREQLKQQLAEHEAQREALYLQPISKADAKQFLFDYIDGWAAQWLSCGALDDLFAKVAKPNRDAEWASANKISDPWLCLRDIEHVMSGELPSTGHVFNLKVLPIFGGALTGMNDTYIGGACFFFGDLLKAKLGEYFDQKYCVGHPTGMACEPVADRRESISTLDGQISELLAAIKMIDDKLTGLGFKDIPPIKVKEVDDLKHGKRLVRA